MADASSPRDRRVALGSSPPATAGGPPRRPEAAGGAGPSRLQEKKEPSATRRSQPSQDEPKGWYSRGYLPHFDAPGLIQHITFHLADSLPKAAIERMERELESLPEEHQSVERRKRIQELLDRGMGSCVLRRPECARVVEDSLLFGDGGRYRLIAWCIMPNHVHVLIEEMEDWPLGKVVQSWKRHTSRQIHSLRGVGETAECNSALPGGKEEGAECNSAIPGGKEEEAECNSAIPGIPLWQRDYWDRFTRDERHFRTVKRYIEENPVVAGLIGKAERWPWGSARFEAEMTGQESKLSRRSTRQEEEKKPSPTRRSQENRGTEKKPSPTRRSQENRGTEKEPSATRRSQEKDRTEAGDV